MFEAGVANPVLRQMGQGNAREQRGFSALAEGNDECLEHERIWPLSN